MQAYARYPQLRLFMPAHPIAQVITDPRPCHAALFPVQRQFQAPTQETFNTSHHSFAGATTTHINVRVIGITHEAVAPPLQLAIEFVEQDVRQQRRERAALRRPFLPSADEST
ncbi:hypothetical protein D3C85_1183810 [compost metagenome]